MARETRPATEFGEGGVGSQKQDFVGTDRGVLSDGQRLPDENPTLMDDDGSLRPHDSGQAAEGEPDAGAGTSTNLTDTERHSGLGGSETSVSTTSTHL